MNELRMQINPFAKKINKLLNKIKLIAKNSSLYSTTDVLQIKIQTGNMFLYTRKKIIKKNAIRQNILLQEGVVYGRCPIKKL